MARRSIEGESNITKAGGSIVKIGCTSATRLHQSAAGTRKLITLSLAPGSLYTSV